MNFSFLILKFFNSHTCAGIKKEQPKPNKEAVKKQGNMVLLFGIICHFQHSP